MCPTSAESRGCRRSSRHPLTCDGGSNPTVTAMKTPERSGVFAYPGSARCSPSKPQAPGRGQGTRSRPHAEEGPGVRAPLRSRDGDQLCPPIWRCRRDAALRTTVKTTNAMIVIVPDDERDEPVAVPRPTMKLAITRPTPIPMPRTPRMRPAVMKRLSVGISVTSPLLSPAAGRYCSGDSPVEVDGVDAAGVPADVQECYAQAEHGRDDSNHGSLREARDCES